MAVEEPVLVVEVALDASHLDDPAGLTYTDLSSRVRGWSWKAGRADQTGKFSTGSIDVTLDNTDRQLDPLNPGGLVPVGDEKGWPLCPCRVTFTYKGNTHPVIGRGFLGPEGWPVTRSPQGTGSTVTITILDVTGVMAWIDLATSPWAAIVKNLAPDWWLPGEVVAPENTADGYLVPNRSGTGGAAETHSAGTRTVTDAVINTDLSLVSASAAFVFTDVGKPVIGDDFTVGTVIDEIVDATEVILTQPTLATSTGVTVTIGAVVDEPVTVDNPLTALDLAGNSLEAPATNRQHSVASATSFGLKSFVSLTSPEADVFPDGDEDELTVSLMWRSANYDNGSLAGAGQAEIFTITSGADRRLRCWIDGDDGGALKLTIYDGAGAELTTLEAPPPATAGPSSYGDNYDDRNSHGIVVRIVGGDTVDLFVDAHLVTESVDVPASAFAGDVTLGEVPAGVAPYALFDELMVFRRALADIDCTRLATAPTLDGSWGRGETVAQRLEVFYESAQWVLLADELDEVHPPPADLVDPDPEVTLVGVEEADGWPATLGAAVVSVADGIAGDAYALRTGKVRVRSILALDDPTHAEAYADLTAHFTDEPSPSPTPEPLRRGPLAFSGTRLDRVVTATKIDYPSIEAGSVSAVPIWAVWLEDRESRFGRRERTAKLHTESKAIPEALATLILDRYPEPPVELGAVNLTPREELAGTVMDWLVTEMELERAVKATDTPPTGDPIVLDPLNVQGWTWSWSDGTRTSVTLNLAKS